MIRSLFAMLILPLVALFFCCPAQAKHKHIATLSAIPAAQQTAVGEDSDGQSLTLPTNQVLVVTLPANPTTGYQWQVKAVDGGVLKQLGDVSYQPDSDRTGSGGMSTLIFLAASAGKTELSLIYVRSWEKDTPPAKTFTLKVEVKEKKAGDAPKP